MEENITCEEARVDSPEEHDSAKRIKTDFEQEESSTSSNNSNSNEKSASTSSDSGLQVSVNMGGNDQNMVNAESDIEQNKNLDRDIQEGEISEEREIENNDDDELDSVLSGSGDYNSHQSDSSESTIIHSTDSDSEEPHVEEVTREVMNKEKPKHTWFMVPEVMNRQLGYGSNKSNPSLFQQRCYGSLRNVQKLELMYKLEDHDGCVNSLNFSPDGTLLASGSDDLKVVIWDWSIGKSITKIETRHRRNVFQTKFLDLKGPDLHLATCARDGQVCYSQIGQEGLRDTRKLGQHRGPCHKLAVLRDQPHVVLSAGEDGIVFNHDVRRSKPNRIVHVKDDDREVALYSIHSHPLRTHQFCVAGRESSVRVYDQRKSSHPLSTHCAFKESGAKFSRGFHITCAVYNHDGSEILASYNDEDVYLFDADAATGQYAHRYLGHKNGATIKGVSFFGAKSEFVMSGSDCGHVFFWERKTEAVAQFLLADDNGVVNCLEPHPQLPFLATSGLDWDVKVWVPSCEDEPAFEHLASTIKENKRHTWTSNQTDSSESQSLPQVLWMLWRRLRASRTVRNTPSNPDAATTGDGGGTGGFSLLSLESSGSDSSSESWRSHSEEDADDDAPGCTTS